MYDTKFAQFSADIIKLGSSPGHLSSKIQEDSTSGSTGWVFSPLQASLQKFVM